MISFFELIVIGVAATSSTFVASEAASALDWTSGKESCVMSLEGDGMILGVEVLAEGEESVEVAIILGGIGLGLGLIARLDLH